LSQSEFAKKVRVPRSKLSEYEGGKKPSIEMLLKLGNFAAKEKRYSDARWFFEEAGVNAGAFPPVTREILKGHVASGQPEELRFIRPTSKISHHVAESPIQFPASMIPNPQATTYVRLSDLEMRPAFDRGDVFIIDESETNILDLHESLIVARRPLTDEDDTFIHIGEKEINVREEFKKSILHERARLAKFFPGRKLIPPPPPSGVVVGWVELEFHDEPGKDVSIGYLYLVSQGKNRYVHRDFIATVEGFTSPTDENQTIFDAEHVTAVDKNLNILGRVIAWIPNPDRGQTSEQEPKK